MQIVAPFLKNSTLRKLSSLNLEHEWFSSGICIMLTGLKPLKFLFKSAFLLWDTVVIILVGSRSHPLQDTLVYPEQWIRSEKRHF